MAIYEVTIPQMGEGLQEARLVRFIKAAGDAINRDEPIFEMETDKATMEIESPVAGVLIGWVVDEGSVVPIGAVVGRIEAEATAGQGIVQPAAGAPAPHPAPTIADPTPALRNALIPPRTRAYARECGLSDNELAELAETLGAKVLPADVDRYMAERTKSQDETVHEQEQDDTVPMSPAQRTLVYRLQQRSGEVIAATEEILVPWEPIDRLRAELKRKGRITGGSVATPFLILAWCVARAVENNPIFRCTYAGDGMLRRHRGLNLGLAVTRGEDELVTARVEGADGLSFGQFIDQVAQAVRRARSGEDQASGVMQLSLSNLAGLDIVRAIPVVVPPAIATIFVGAVHRVPMGSGDQLLFGRAASVTMTFDHRVVNGVGAARMLAAIRRQVEALDMGSLVATE